MRAVHQCACVPCVQQSEAAVVAEHRVMNLLLSRLDEQQRRWYAAAESHRIGWGGDRVVARLTGLTEPTIRRGRRELAADLAGRPHDRIRLPGGGRPRIEKKSRAGERAPGAGGGGDGR